MATAFQTLRPMRLLLVIAIASFMLCYSVRLANADFRFCNQAKLPIYAALLHYSDSGWISEGWTYVWPGECRPALVGPVKFKRYWIYAESLGNAFAWTGKLEFCVKYGSEFKINEEDCKNGSFDRRKFREVDVGDAVLDNYNVPITCKNCVLPDVQFDKEKHLVTIVDVAPVTRQGVSFEVPVLGYFRFRIDEARQVIRVTAQVHALLTDLRMKFSSLLSSRMEMDDECGDRFKVNRADIKPDGAVAKVSANATYARWVCTYANLPQFKCEDTWIEYPGFKTKGIPNCETWMETVRTSKNKLFQQSGEIKVRLTPHIRGDTDIYLSTTVESVQLDGFGQAIANLFNVNLRSIAQDMVDSALDESVMSVAMPDDLRGYVKFQSVSFSDVGLTAEGEFDVNGQQIISLCRKFWAEGKCQQN
ncbi:DUF1036 domain-containing protein [Mesorhizobium sp.]|uniref:DUF1036 domain-containing protein n=1 Tax=Mesorhizobium sp. TaxID=1871066 RepID=UPI00257E8B30|nr:DUF1036 domain-containing protein [Mesorhizobium sp.]